MAGEQKGRAEICWEGDSREVIAKWPKAIRQDFGIALDHLQCGGTPMLKMRSMASIAPGVYELKDADAAKWYRLIYLTKVRDTIYILHCFAKDTRKTETRDLATARARLKRVEQRILEERRDEKARSRAQ